MVGGVFEGFRGGVGRGLFLVFASIRSWRT